MFMTTIINMSNTQNLKIINTFTATQAYTNTVTTTQIGLRDITAEELAKKSATYMQRSKPNLMALCRTLGFSVTSELTKPMLIQLIMSTHMKVEVI